MSRLFTSPAIGRRRLVLGTLLGAAASVRAQTTPAYPSRPVTWVVPYAAGGGGDTLGRLLAKGLTAGLGQPVVVDNKAGAGGQIGVNAVKLAPADGYTILYGDIGPFAMNTALYPKLSYDMSKDFIPLTRLLVSSTLLLVPAKSPVNSLADLVKLGGGSTPLNYGSYGVGSLPHIWMEMFKAETRGNFNHIAYKGAAPAIQDLLGGQIDLMVDVAVNSIPLARDGRLKALAVIGSSQRLPQLPNVPTMTELGYPGIDTPGWSGVAVRAGTPPAVVARLHEEIVRALLSPEVAQRYADTGTVPSPMSVAQFTEFVGAETRRWGAVIKRAGVTLE